MDQVNPQQGPDVAENNNHPNVVPAAVLGMLQGRKIVRMAIRIASLVSAVAVGYFIVANRCHTSLSSVGFYACHTMPQRLLDAPYSDLHAYTMITVSVLVATALSQLLV